VIRESSARLKAAMKRECREIAEECKEFLDE